MKALYLTDSYLQEWETSVVSVKDGKYVTLKETAFYPTSGGQPFDTGTITRISDNSDFKVVFVGKFNSMISHEVTPEGLKVGDKVKCKIDWERRYKLMRSHTATHILGEVIFRESGALVTGGQLDIEKCRMDFAIENYDLEQVKQWVEKANEIIGKDLQVSVSFMSREKAEELPQLSKLAKGLSPELKEVRIVSIGDFDIQADGGTHVKSTKEIGKIEFIKCDNRGKQNRRIYYKIV
jgi:misacylated tRNA(Ala) deacylase